MEVRDRLEKIRFALAVVTDHDDAIGRQRQRRVREVAKVARLERTEPVLRALRQDANFGLCAPTRVGATPASPALAAPPSGVQIIATITDL
jgi:hypothetical protein